MTACRDCAAKLGLVPMGESRRPPVPCQRCNGMKFVRAIPREYTSGSNRDLSAPMAVTHRIELARGWLGPEPLRATPLEHRAGQLELFICHACGFVEWYCDEPGALPISPLCMTELVDYAPDAPFR